MEAFACRTEKAREVIKGLQKEIVSRLGCPQSTQSDNGPALVPKTATGVSQMLRTQWRLYYTLKITMAKLCQTARENWLKLLPAALTHMGAAPKGRPSSAPLRCYMEGPLWGNMLWNVPCSRG